MRLPQGLRLCNKRLDDRLRAEFPPATLLVVEPMLPPHCDMVFGQFEG